MDLNVLIGVPSPRDIPEVLEAIDKLPSVDKLFVKYMEEIDAYEVMRDFFLCSKKYDYLCIIPDDLIVTTEGFQTLLEDVNKYKMPVISGVCNVTMTDMKDYWAVRTLGSKGFLHKEKDKRIHSKFEIVYFNAFACCFISKSVIEKIPFRVYSPTFVSALDDTFAQDCLKKDIPVMVDWQVQFIHLANRVGDGTHQNWGKGIREPYQLFVAKN